MAGDPETLGEKLTRQPVVGVAPQSWTRRIVYAVLNGALWAAFLVLGLWWGMTQPPTGTVAVLGIGLIAAWVCLAFWATPRKHAPRPATHFLLAGDHQQFVAGLRLDAKTAVLDGNNIYHFGLAHDLGAQALQRIAQQLRAEGYRIVCFFDANIHYTLIESGAAAADQRHSLGVLEQVFGLRADEVYVVPSGVQADKYILSTLNHLPISFVVTNDQFRDYAKVFPSVMKGDQWRKGMTATDTELRLHKFRFQTPLRLDAPTR